jgi:hypothetical protein
MAMGWFVAARPWIVAAGWVGGKILLSFYSGCVNLKRGK